MRREVWACGMAAVGVVRDHLAAWLGAAVWYGILSAAALHGHAMLDAVRLTAAQAEESAGITVLVLPDAAGLATLSQAIERLPGVRDATFVMSSHVLDGMADTLRVGHPPPSLYVRTQSSHPESLEALAAAIRSFPQVEATVYHPEAVGHVRDTREAVERLPRAAWFIAAVVLMAALWIPCAGLVRAERHQAVIAYALGLHPLAASGPTSLAGACAGAMGGLAGWAAAGVLGAGSTHSDAGIAFGTVTGAAVLGAVGPLVHLHGALRGRRPIRVEVEE